MPLLKTPPHASRSAHPLRARLLSWLTEVRATEARLLLSILGLLAALWGFLALTDEVREGGTLKLDHKLLLAFRTPGNLDHPIGPRWMQESARDFTAVGGFTILLLVSVMAFVILMLLRRRTQAWIFGVTVVVAQIASQVIKMIVHRPRPDLVPQHDIIYSASFPSGHSMMAPVVYLTLAAIIAAGHRRRAIKVFLLAGAALLVIVIGVSRVYLGVHWPTDVIAGWTLGAMIALCADIALIKTAPRKGPAAEVKPDVPPPDAVEAEAA